MTVDVKGSGPLWLKVKDLAEGMTYRFRICAKTFAYGPEIEANVTTGPGEGEGAAPVATAYFLQEDGGPGTSGLGAARGTAEGGGPGGGLMGWTVRHTGQQW